jgi:hypothetical protein
LNETAYTVSQPLSLFANDQPNETNDTRAHVDHKTRKLVHLSASNNGRSTNRSARNVLGATLAHQNTMKTENGATRSATKKAKTRRHARAKRKPAQIQKQSSGKHTT